MGPEKPSFLIWSPRIKHLVHHEVFCISLSCLLSFLCNPYNTYEIFIYLSPAIFIAFSNDWLSCPLPYGRHTVYRSWKRQPINGYFFRSITYSTTSNIMSSVYQSYKNTNTYSQLIPANVCLIKFIVKMVHPCKTTHA